MSSSFVDDIRQEVPSDKKIMVSSAVPVFLKYSFSLTDPTIRNYYPGGYQGIAIGLLNIGAGEAHGYSKALKYIGNPVLLYIFQGGPFWKINPSLSLNYEWNFGASFGWKPFSEANEYFNLTVGSRVNAYLNLNLLLKWQINTHAALFGGLAVNHFSNGNTSWPNPGVNSFGLRVGMEWIINPLKKEFESAPPDTIRKRKVEYDITAWGASRKRVYRGGEKPLLLNGRFGCAGISFAPMVRLNRWWRVGGSADIQWDGSSDKKKYYIAGTTSDDITFRNPSFFRQISWGISAHGELQMPIFAVNIGLGYNLYAPQENRNFYQNITLKTYLGSKVFLNVGYQLRNFHQQACLMLGMGVTL